jgi:hypothetical protein
MRSTARSATRKSTTIRSEPSRRTTFRAAPAPAVPGARVAIEVPSADGSSRQARQQLLPSDITTFPLTHVVSLPKQHMTRSPSTTGRF